jgi:prevent-host-death family protein
MTAVPVRDLRNHTAAVLRRVQAGEDVTITQNGVPVASLVPLREKQRKPMPKAELTRLLDRTEFDPTLAADLERIAGDTTDDLGPIA